MNTQQTYPISSALPFRTAAAQWLTEHSRFVRPGTVRVYQQYLDSLAAFFGDLPLKSIQIGNIREYQRWRSERAGPLRINAEVCSALQQVLKQAGLWKQLEEFYKPLKVPPARAGHSITAKEEQRLREVALSRPKWLLAGHCMIVMINTTMGFGELRQLRRRDVDMEARKARVREGAKNVYRERDVPLNRSAFESMTWILDRWAKLGGTGNDDYILPHYRRRTEAERQGRGHRASKTPVDFSVPMGQIYRAVRAIVKETGLDCFRVYDCRVQAITKLLSNPNVSPQVAREIAGHISQAMQDRYSIQQLNTKRAALEAIDSLEGDAEAVAETPELPTSTPAAPDVLVHPAVQAEIARQVALVLGHGPEPEAVSKPGPRLIIFPVRNLG